MGRYVGLEGAIIGLNRFGASAPGEIVMRELGFSQSTLSQLRNLSWPVIALDKTSVKLETSRARSQVATNARAAASHYCTG